MKIVTRCLLIIEHHYIHKSCTKVVKMDETLGTNVSNRWGMGGGLTTLLYGWATDAGTAVFIGIVVTVLGFIMSCYFQRKRQLREKAEIDLRTELLLREEARKKELHQARLKRILGAGVVTADE